MPNVSQPPATADITTSLRLILHVVFKRYQLIEQALVLALIEMLVNRIYPENFSSLLEHQAGDAALLGAGIGQPQIYTRFLGSTRRLVLPDPVGKRPTLAATSTRQHLVVLGVVPILYVVTQAVLHTRKGTEEEELFSDERHVG